MDTRILEEIGLTKQEAEIYIILLREGSSTATIVSKKSKIERTLVYRILDRLIEKGIVNFKIENKVKRFKAINPERLLIELKEKEKELSSYLPLLKSLVKEKEKEPDVEIYTGIKGVESLAREVLRAGKDYDILAGEIKSKSMEYFIGHLMKEIEIKNIHERILVEKGRRITLKSKNTKVRHLPENFGSKTTTGIGFDRIAIILWSEPFLAVVIKDKNLANTYKGYFNLLWKIAKT